MNITKKVLAILFAVVLVVSMFAVSAAAIDPKGDEALTYTVTTDKEAYDPGDVVTVSVKINTNFNYTTFRVPVLYDASMYELNTITTLTLYNDCKTYGTGQVNADGFSLLNEDAGYSEDDWGCVVVQWLGSVADNKLGVINTNGADQLAFSFKLVVKDDATPGYTGTIKIPAEYNGFYNQAIMDPADGNTIYYLDETFTPLFIDANPSVVGDMVELVPVEGTDTIIDNENFYIYGIQGKVTSDEELKAYITATGNGELEIFPTEIGYGTGAQVVLESSTLDPIAFYTVVIFGDANGDDSIDAYDFSEIIKYASGKVAQPTDYLLKATDLNTDLVVDPFDTTIMAGPAAGKSVIDQTNPSKVL